MSWSKSSGSVCDCQPSLKRKQLYLLHFYRQRLEFPELKRAIVGWAAYFHASNILFEDKASGTALIQELIRDGVAGFTKYEPIMDKIMRLHSVSSTIENGFVYLPQQADWLAEYLNELTTFPSVFLGLRGNKPHDVLLPEFRHEERLQLLTPTHF
jgi:predicted phage terminase large subunit-like protein